jgi:4-amino-4-deoxy-L-arabinose transferase-like glycosyltransferase
MDDSVTTYSSIPRTTRASAPANLGKLRSGLFFATLTLGLLRAWASRQAMDPDGIAYLDMADSYLRRDWYTALNGLWSPFYSWLLGAAILIFRPSPAFEFPMVHAVNAVIFSIMLMSFDRLLVSWLKFHEPIPAEPTTNARFPQWAFLVLAYTLVAFTSLDWMSMQDVGPDYLVAASAFTATALALKLCSTGKTLRTAAAFGLVLGLGYLAKAPMFPIAILFFILLFVYLPAPARKGQLTMAILCFFAVAAPLMITLSISKGRPTFSDSGSLNYAWHVNRKPLVHWRGDTDMVAVHPTRQIHDNPDAFEFNGPLPTTYPAFYDPSYWEEGISPRFVLWQQLAALKHNALVLFQTLLQSAPLWFAITILLLMGRGLHRYSKNDIAWGFIWIAPSVLAMFCLIHLEPRYVAPFAVISVMAMCNGIRLPESLASRKLFAMTAISLCLVCTGFEIRQLRVELRSAAENNREHLNVAYGLNEMGIKAGDKVGNIGDSFDAYWARLARVSIITEVPEPVAARIFWQSNSTTQQQTLDAMFRAGAKAVITENPPVTGLVWQKIKGSEHYYVTPRSRN